MLIRKARMSDVSMIAQVHVNTWLTTYRGIVPDEYLTLISHEKRSVTWERIISREQKSGQFTYVAEDQSGQVVGFANGGKERSGDAIYKGELNAIYILKSHQRQGIGYQLVTAVVERFAQMGINSMLAWVLADNSACKFYETLGGEIIYHKQIERGRLRLSEVAYGWQDTSAILKHDLGDR